ncbi:MAG: response regulator transcription factor [Anaerolineae bacterium]|jgi:DNA-binding response OmpR family regulator|nr:response regulator transcription factor [Anaerolineae bacterium]
MAYKILLADDESHILDTLSAYLKAEGFLIFTAKNGKEALFAFRHEKPDLVILDVMMPEMDGWQTARLIRKESDLPILFLTARVDDSDQIMGLEIGADEYITKPFSPRVVVAKVRALIRRAYGDMQAEMTIYTVGDLEMNVEGHTVKRGGDLIDLTPSEFSLLQLMMSRPGRVFSRMALLEHLQGEAYAPYERTIDVHIKNLRLKLEADTQNPSYIETVYGVGYKMRTDT